MTNLLELMKQSLFAKSSLKISGGLKESRHRPRTCQPSAFLPEGPMFLSGWEAGKLSDWYGFNEYPGASLNLL
jgi:hypothetical protein